MEFNKISRENVSSNSDFEEEKRKNVDNFQYYLDLAKKSKLSWDVLNTLMNDLCSSRTKSKRLNILLLKELKFLSEANSKLQNKVEKIEKLNKRISNNDGNPMMTKKAKVKENLPNRDSAPKISRVHEDTYKSESITTMKRKKISDGGNNTELKFEEISSEEKEIEPDSQISDNWIQKDSKIKYGQVQIKLEDSENFEIANVTSVKKIKIDQVLDTKVTKNVKNHKKLSVHECSLCFKVFKQAKQLKIHISCGPCGQSFTQAGNFKKHQVHSEQEKSKVTKLRKNQCPHCLMQFKFADNLNCHIESVHTKKSSPVPEDFENDDEFADL